jgi:hypothetical protein
MCGPAAAAAAALGHRLRGMGVVGARASALQASAPGAWMWMLLLFVVLVWLVVAVVAAVAWDISRSMADSSSSLAAWSDAALLRAVLNSERASHLRGVEEGVCVGVGGWGGQHTTAGTGAEQTLLGALSKAAHHTTQTPRHTHTRRPLTSLHR